MLGITFGSRRQRQRFGFSQRLHRGNPDNAMLTLRQRTRLIKDHYIHQPRLFKRQPVAYQNTVARRQRRADRHHQRHGQSQRMRTGDHAARLQRAPQHLD